LLSHTTIGFTTTKPFTWASAAPQTKNALAENGSARVMDLQRGLKFPIFASLRKVRKNSLNFFAQV
jgi:hypothetical protein